METNFVIFPAKVSKESRFPQSSDFLPTCFPFSLLFRIFFM